MLPPSFNRTYQTVQNMQKFYGIYGKTTALVRIEANGGKAYLQCEFKRGNPNPGAAYRPAVYVSSSRSEQDIIENSPYFGRLIKLIRVIGDPSPLPEAEAAVRDAEVNGVVKEYPDVTDIDQARAVLKSLGAKATVLASPEAMERFMTAKQVSFPNFQF